MSYMYLMASLSISQSSESTNQVYLALIGYLNAVFLAIDALFPFFVWHTKIFSCLEAYS